MFDKEITFDRFVRMLSVVLLIVGVLMLVNYLSAVLLPFFVGWLLAYLLNPLVNFIEHKLHVPSRALSIVISMLFVGLVVAAVTYFIIPPMIEQFQRLGEVTIKYLNQKSVNGDFAEMIRNWMIDNQQRILEFFKSPDFTEALKVSMPKVFAFIGKTANVMISVVASCITLLYMFFILLDYEKLTTGWLRIFPKKARPFWQDLMKDVAAALNNYIRGQGMVAFCMGVMFCIGFTIIDFPMAIGLGILIGIMDMVPYLHTFALIPTAFLALLKAADTGQNFWIIFGSAVLVFIVVQIITDMVTTPKIMGDAMGLNPAVLLLSISVWGTLLGFIGLIVALPLTTLIIAYYERYVTKDYLDRALPSPDQTSPSNTTMEDALHPAEEDNTNPVGQKEADVNSR
jgi:predicted PurR-regulated permease PerM